MQFQSLDQKLEMLKEQSGSLPDIIVFSHLRWEFVKQRPQQLLERFAAGQRILFVEEPISDATSPPLSANVITINDQITVLQPRVNTENWSDLARIINRNYTLDSDRPIVWFYSASFLPMIDQLNYSLLVYDCMDELSAFKGAPASLRANEKKLLSLADVVFTGGKSLFESKRAFNPNTYCFPSSVDRKHFQKAFAKATAIPSDIARLRKPIVGFYGVIDERIDLNLLQDVAHSTPEANFAMIGPVVKIDPTTLPQAKNIHYLGAKNYEELPSYLKAFTVTMMPFAMNESTQFISPTKTLEYMAARKPIISTPIKDVRRDYSKEVCVVKTAEAFREAVLRYINETKTERKVRVNLQDAAIERTSWDATVESMRKILQKAYREAEEIRLSENLLSNPSPRLQLQFNSFEV